MGFNTASHCDILLFCIFLISAQILLKGFDNLLCWYLVILHILLHLTTKESICSQNSKEPLWMGDLQRSWVLGMLPWAPPFSPHLQGKGYVVEKVAEAKPAAEVSS